MSLPCPNKKSVFGSHEGIYEDGILKISGARYTRWRCKICHNTFISTKGKSDGKRIELNGTVIFNYWEIQENENKRLSSIFNSNSNETKEKNIQETINKNKKKTSDAPAKRAIPEMSFEDFYINVLTRLSRMKLEERLYISDLKIAYPNYHGKFIFVDKLNDELHKINKEVTYLNDYYILVEIGFHAERLRNLEEMKHYQYSLGIQNPGYRDDISNFHGSFHLRREETGRIASDSFEDYYDD